MPSLSKLTNKIANAAKQSTNRTSARLQLASKSKTQKQDDPIGSVTITANTLNVRNGAGTNYKRIGGLTKGKQVQYFEEKDGWLRIAYGTQEGWISAKYTDYVAPTNQATEEKGLFDVIIDVKNYLNIRSGPGTNYDVLGKFYGGEKITVLEEKDGWYRFLYNGQEAWVSAEYTKKTDSGSNTGGDEPSQNTEGGSPGEIAAAEAERLMKIYVDNGYTYSQSERKKEGHYDCSSFTHRCWKAAGLDLKWATAANQFKRIDKAGGRVNSKNDIKPGHLLFWKADKDNDRYLWIKHVAIAINKSKRIDAGRTPVRSDKIGSPDYIGDPNVLL